MRLLHMTALPCGIRWLLASADDTAVPFFVRCGFSRKVTIPKRIYSKVLKTYDNTLLLELDLAEVASTSLSKPGVHSLLAPKPPGNGDAVGRDDKGWG